MSDPISWVAEIADGIGGVRNGEGLLFVLKAYFDGSGTHDQSDAVLWAGIIGRAHQWENLSHRWKEVLAEARDGRTARYYHRSEVMAGNHEFLGWPRASLDNLTHDLRQVILESGLHGFAAGTFKQMWKKAVRPPIDQVIKGPEAFCFTECIRWAREWSSANADGAEVALFFNEDHQEPSIRKAREVQSFIHGGIAGVTFLPAKPHPEIQAADMLAGESWVDLKNWRQDGDHRQIGPHLKPFIESGRFSAALADEDIIRSWTQRFWLGRPPDLPESLWPSDLPA